MAIIKKLHFQLKGIKMNKLLAKISIFSLLMTASIYGWAHQDKCSYKHSCKSIVMACKQNGYYKGGDKKGKGLMKDCVVPVAKGNKQLPNTHFSKSQLHHCKKKLEHVKGKMHHKKHHKHHMDHQQKQQEKQSQQPQQSQAKPQQSQQQ